MRFIFCLKCRISIYTQEKRPSNVSQHEINVMNHPTLAFYQIKAQ